MAVHAPLEILFEDCGDLGVAVGQDLTTGHHEAHLRPQALEDVSELHAGDAGADDDDVLGDVDHVVAVPRRENLLPVDRCPLGDRGDEPVETIARSNATRPSPEPVSTMTSRSETKRPSP